MGLPVGLAWVERLVARYFFKFAGISKWRQVAVAWARAKKRVRTKVGRLICIADDASGRSLFNANENPYKISWEEMEIAGGGKRLVRGRFILVRLLKSHFIFLKEDWYIAYGVPALQDDFETVLGPDLPIMLETVLLPFRDRIIYDGVLSAYRSDSI